MDPVRSNFYDFPPDLAISHLHNPHSCYIENIYLLYESKIVSSAEKLDLHLQEGGGGSYTRWLRRKGRERDQ